MTTEKKRFTRLADALAGYLKASGLEARFEEAAVVPEWAERVGPAIAAVTTPLSVSHGTLRVGVRSSAWLSELHLVEREIVRRLNAGRARGQIRRIQFVQVDPGDARTPQVGGERAGGGRQVRPGIRGQRKP